MIRKFSSLSVLLFFSLAAFAQQPGAPQPASDYYVDLKADALAPILSSPPAQNSEVQKAELAEMHRIEQARTPAQVAAAQKDEKDTSIFLFRNVLGEKFRAEELPLTAALSEHVHNDGWAANMVKEIYKRPRPYQADTTLHPVCGTTPHPNSYPSGHTLAGYLEAFTLIEIVPEKRAEILARAEDYAHNRLVCGVHFPSDLAGGRDLAYTIFGAMLASPRFQSELAAARAETRKQLGLN
jgi:acid phosphatase (class A)